MSVNAVTSNAYGPQGQVSRTRINTDLSAVLADLQTPASGGSTQAATPASTAAGGAGSLSSDLQSFFSDLQSAAGAPHGHHHHGPSPHEAGSRDGAGSQDARTNNAGSTTDLLSGVVEALHSYGAQLTAPPSASLTATA